MDACLEVETCAEEDREKERKATVREEKEEKRSKKIIHRDDHNMQSVCVRI